MILITTPSGRSQDSQTTLPSTEVKQMLQDIGFVLRLSRGIKLEIVNDANGRMNPTASLSADTLLLAA